MRSTDERFLEFVRRYIGRFQMDVAPDEDPLDWYLFSGDCGLEKPGMPARGKKKLYRGGLLMYSGFSREEMAGRLLSGVRDLIVTQAGPFMRARAGGVATDRGAVLMPSLPDAHLPALVAMLLHSRAGAYVGDEVVLIDPVLRKAHPLPIPLLVETQDLTYLPDLGRDPPRRRRRDERRGRPLLPARQPVSPEELGSRPADPSDVRWIAFPEFGPGSPTEVIPITQAEAVFRLTQSLLDAHIWGDRSLILARDVVQDAATSRVVIGDLGEGRDALLSWVSSTSE